MGNIEKILILGDGSMKRKYIFIVFLPIFCFLYTNQVFASRAFAPEKIPPVIYKDIKFVAENSSPENMGIVQAFHVNTDKLIWSKKVYTVKINPNVEEDTQEIYIKEMKIENDKLVIINENQKKYILNPNTGNDFNNKNILTRIVIILIPVAVIICMVIKQYRKRKKTKNSI